VTAYEFDLIPDIYGLDWIGPGKMDPCPTLVCQPQGCGGYGYTGWSKKLTFSHRRTCLHTTCHIISYVCARPTCFHTVCLLGDVFMRVFTH